LGRSSSDEFIMDEPDSAFDDLETQ
jgi:hypothetical protein